MDHLDSLERFKDAWKSQFPQDDVPDVSFLKAGAARGRTRYVLQDELEKVNGTITKLESELQQQKFLQSWIQKELDELEQFRKMVAGMKTVVVDKNMAAEGVSVSTNTSHASESPGSHEDGVGQNSTSKTTDNVSKRESRKRTPLYESIEDFPFKPPTSESKLQIPNSTHDKGNTELKQNKEVSNLDLGGAVYTQVLRKSQREKPQIKPKPASFRRSTKTDRTDNIKPVFTKPFVPPPPLPEKNTPELTHSKLTPIPSTGLPQDTSEHVHEPKDVKEQPNQVDRVYESIGDFGDTENPLYDNYETDTAVKTQSDDDKGNIVDTPLPPPPAPLYESLNNPDTPNDSDDIDFSSDSMDDLGFIGRTNPISTPVVKFREDVEVLSASSSVKSTDTLSSDSISMDFPDESSPVDMRQLVVAGILESDGAYKECLETLRNYMRLLKASSTLSQPAMVMTDYDVIFFKIDELYDMSVKFYNDLQKRVDTWTPGQQVGDLFLDTAKRLGIYGDYVNNYQVAMEALERCRHENPDFENAVESIPKPSSKENVVTLEGLLYKPLQRVTKMTLTLHDLMKHTPEDNPDYGVLEKALHISEQFLNQVNEKAKIKAKKHKKLSKKDKQGRKLLKDGYVVELVDNSNRKLRHVFLYSDVLLCAKQKTVTGLLSGPKEQFDCKWYIPLKDLFLSAQDDASGNTATSSLPLTSEKELEGLRARISEANIAIVEEQKKKNKGAQKNLDKYVKRERELKGQMLLQSPNLPLKLINRKGKSYMLLMSSDYERSEWREAIDKAQHNNQSNTSVSLTAFEIQSLTAKQKSRNSKNLSSFMIRDVDEELMSGILSFNVHSATNFSREGAYYCCIEVDSYGHFYLIAKTNSTAPTKDPDWDQEFELDVDGAQSLRILCYRSDTGNGGDQLVCKGAYEMRRLPKKQEIVEIKLDLVEGGDSSSPVQFSFTLSYDSHGRQTMRRLKSRRNGGIFGVPIARVARRQGVRVPNIVRICCTEIEKRGLSEMGIYRISGVTSDIQKIKKAFEMSGDNVEHLVANSDIHAVACVLKQYFRELPEPLFTNEKYNNFVEGRALSDPNARDKCMSSLLDLLPEPNRSTVFYVINHLRSVAENQSENKMSLHNLATVFGPNLLRPSSNPTEETGAINSSMLLEASCFTNAMAQVGVLLYFLEGKGQVIESHDL